MKKILFVAYGGGHINIIDLIAEKLIDERDIEFKILALTTAYSKVAAKYPKGVVVKVSDYRHLFAKELDMILKLGTELLQENYNPSSGISKEDTIMYLGLSMYDLIQTYGENKARELYASKKRQAFLPVETMKKIIVHEKSNMIVSTTSPRFEQASLIAGNQLGIETIEILDLFGNLHPLPEAKHIVCLNTKVIDQLKERGLYNRYYYPFGQPVIEDSIKKIKSINKSLVYTKTNLNKENKTLLYASQVPILHNDDGTFNSFLDYEKTNSMIFNILEKVYKEFKINIIFRIHPNEDIKNYKKFFKSFPFIQPINDILSLQESIAIADYVITPYSTVAVESLSENRLVFTYRNDFDTCYPIEEMKQSPFIFANGFHELENNLFFYLKNGNQIKVENFLPKNSIEQIVDLIKKI